MNMGTESRVNAVERTMTSRWRDFVRMNPPLFLLHKVLEDTQEFLDGVYKVLNVNQVNRSVEKYLLNLSMFFIYESFLVFIINYEKSMFVTGFADLVKKECYMTMLNNKMTVPKLMAYAQYIELAKLVVEAISVTPLFCVLRLASRCLT